GGSNSRPRRCERRALPTELAAPRANPQSNIRFCGSQRTRGSRLHPFAIVERMTDIRRIGILTGGGDAPGLNAVIRAVVKSACNAGIVCVGLEDSFDGLLEFNHSRELTPRDVTGILRLGGTILGTVNTGDPFAASVATSEGPRVYSDRVM